MIINSLPKGTRFRITFDLIRDVPISKQRSREELSLPELPSNYYARAR
jgi:hypothetical protein